MCAATSVYGLHTNDGLNSDIEMSLLLPKIRVYIYIYIYIYRTGIYFFFCVTVGAPFLPALITSTYVKFPEWS